MAYWEYSLFEYIGLIVSLFCLPLFGFFLGRHFTTARLDGEHNRANELQGIHDLIEHNHKDVGEQIQPIYREIEHNHKDVGDQIQPLYKEIDEVWKKLREVDKNRASADQPLYQTTTTS